VRNARAHGLSDHAYLRALKLRDNIAPRIHAMKLWPLRRAEAVALSTYAHLMPEAQREAVDRLGERFERLAGPPRLTRRLFTRSTICPKTFTGDHPIRKRYSPFYGCHWIGDFPWVVKGCVSRMSDGTVDKE
jgi:hypothetical protein